jgi:hypothetical protein
MYAQVMRAVVGANFRRDRRKSLPEAVELAGDPPARCRRVVPSSGPRLPLQGGPTETKGSDGSREGVVRYVLIVGLVLVVIAFIVAYLFR